MNEQVSNSCKLLKLNIEMMVFSVLWKQMLGKDLNEGRTGGHLPADW